MAKRYIADLHFGHKNILAYDNRPFADIKTHDAEIMEQWNNSVSENDDVFILGDVSWHSAAKTAGLMQRLNGTKHLIIGNHDGELLKSKSYRNCFQEIEHYLEIEDEGQKIILCHYPILSVKPHTTKVACFQRGQRPHAPFRGAECLSTIPPELRTFRLTPSAPHSGELTWIRCRCFSWCMKELLPPCPTLPSPARIL